MFIESMRRNFPDITDEVIRDTALNFVKGSYGFPENMKELPICEQLGRMHKWFVQKFQVELSMNKVPAAIIRNSLDIRKD